MIGTESRLWEVLQGAAREARGRFTRIETAATSAGVADVEYVLLPWHGWIELKTCAPPRRGRPFNLHCPFTISQCSWLVSHHAPAHRLRSYVLIGVTGPRTWSRFVLVSAPASTHLLATRKGLAHEKLLTAKGVWSATTLQGVIAALLSTEKPFQRQHKEMET